MHDALTSLEGRLLLRRPRADDIDHLYAIFADPLTNLYNPSPVTSRREAVDMLGAHLAHWSDHGFGLWAIAEVQEEGRVLGFGGLSLKTIDGQRRINLGYRFATDAWGRGLATEMGRSALAEAFKTLKADAVYAYVRPANIPSIRVLDRLGMALVGTYDDVVGDVPSLVYRTAPG